jgi:hypothetical protein
MIFGKRMDMFFLPSQHGTIKLFVYGFHPLGNGGQVYAELNGITVKVKGFQRKRVIVRALRKLHELLLNQEQ